MLPGRSRGQPFLHHLGGAEDIQRTNGIPFHTHCPHGTNALVGAWQLTNRADTVNISDCYSQILEPPAGLDVLPHPWKMLNSYSFWQRSIGHERSLLQLLHLSKQNRLSVPYSIHQYSMKPGHHKSPQNQTSSIPNPTPGTMELTGSTPMFSNCLQMWPKVFGTCRSSANTTLQQFFLGVGYRWAVQKVEKPWQMCFFLQSHKYSALRLSTSDPPPLGLKWTNVNSQTLLCKAMSASSMLKPSNPDFISQIAELSINLSNI